MTVPDRSNSLAVLAARIQTHHQEVTAAAKRTVESAMAAGDCLLEAKKQLKHGQWGEWLAANCPFSARTATGYMRLAAARSQIGITSDLSVNEALALLAPIPEPPHWLQVFLLEIENIHPGIQVTPSGMSFPDDLTREQWLAVGRLLNELPHVPAEARA